jgi:hypothetical protein
VPKSSKTFPKLDHHSEREMAELILFVNGHAPQRMKLHSPPPTERKMMKIRPKRSLSTK